MDAESSCGVCGGSLIAVPSQGLEQLVHTVPETRHFREPSKVAQASIIMAVVMTGGGTVLFVLGSALGLGLLFGGLVLGLLVIGGPGVGWGGGRGDSSRARRAMRRAQVEENEKERKKRTGEED